MLGRAAEPVAGVPKVDVKVLPVPANAADPNGFVALLSSTGAPVAMGSTGLNNVSIGAPVTIQGVPEDAKSATAKYQWTLSKPNASSAILGDATTGAVWFTPDVSGIYKIDLVATNASGSSPMASVQVQAGEYIGVEAGGCVNCHPAKVAEWSKTKHATKFTRDIDGGADPATTKYNEGCIRCHTTGYYIGASNGGFADVQAKLGWQFPSLESIKKGEGNWDAVPKELKNMANIQCEACHGPAKDHVLKGAKMASSVDSGVCNQCHDTGGSHIRGSELRNAKHSEENSRAWTYPTGPSRQACVRCHSGEGYISFTKNPTEQASWNNNAEALSCAACHDPHSEANKAQLRVGDVPVEVAGITKNLGLSATCAECHNSRTVPADALKGSYPHYSAAVEMLSDTDGVDYGLAIPNSPHGSIVGTAPVANPNNPSAKLFLGETPGPCVACHMWPVSTDTKDPNRLKVGDHSFNALSPDGKVQYTAACQQCHPGLTEFNFPAKADYDGNGKVEGVQTEVAGLLNVLLKAISDSGIRPIQGNPYFNRDDLAKANEKQKNAIYNYRFVRGLENMDGRSSAIHNFKRSVGLLQASYRDLTGKDVPGATSVLP